MSKVRTRRCALACCMTDVGLHSKRKDQQRVLGREGTGIWIVNVTSQTSMKELVAKAESRWRGVSGVEEGWVDSSWGQGGATQGAFLYLPNKAPTLSACHVSGRQ